MVFLGIGSIFPNEGRLGHWSEAISTVKVGEAGVKPGHLLWSLSRKKPAVVLVSTVAWCLLHKSFWHLLLTPGLRCPRGITGFFTPECKNPRNHRSLRKCVLIRFILGGECSCTLPLQYIFTAGFIKNDSARQMARSGEKSGSSDPRIQHFWIYSFTCIIIFGFQHKSNKRKLWNMVLILQGRSWVSEVEEII